MGALLHGVVAPWHCLPHDTDLPFDPVSHEGEFSMNYVVFAGKGRSVLLRCRVEVLYMGSFRLGSQAGEVPGEIRVWSADAPGFR